MELNDLSDELKEKLMAVETLEELTALAEENGLELADEDLEGVAGGGMRPKVISGDSCRAKVIYVPCKKF